MTTEVTRIRIKNITGMNLNIILSDLNIHPRSSLVDGHMFCVQSASGGGVWRQEELIVGHSYLLTVVDERDRCNKSIATFDIDPDAGYICNFREILCDGFLTMDYEAEGSVIVLMVCAPVLGPECDGLDGVGVGVLDGIDGDGVLD